MKSLAGRFAPALLATVAALAVLVPGIATAQITTYDFNSLTGNDIHPWASLDGQDGWTSQGYVVPGVIGVTATLGFDGTQDIRYPHGGPGWGADASRLSGGSFVLPALSGQETAVALQADFQVGTWGNQLALGYDKNANNVIRRTTPEEIGPRIDIGTTLGVQVVSASGAVAGSAPLSALGAAGGSWIRLRLVMDLTANAGAGAGDLLYQNLTTGDTALQPVAGLQDVNLGLDQSADDARDPTLFNGVFNHQEGTDNAIDNLVVESDTTPPNVTYSGNAGSYLVTDTITISCAASDDVGVVSDTCAVNSLSNKPAWMLGLGSHTLTATATDAAGNEGSGTATFTVEVTPASLCTLTKRFVRESPNYLRLRSGARQLVDLLVDSACRLLTDIGPNHHPSRAAKYIRAYQGGVNALARSGWLTSAQAGVLGELADGLLD